MKMVLCFLLSVFCYGLYIPVEAVKYTTVEFWSSPEGVHILDTATQKVVEQEGWVDDIESVLGLVLPPEIIDIIKSEIDPKILEDLQAHATGVMDKEKCEENMKLLAGDVGYIVAFGYATYYSRLPLVGKMAGGLARLAVHLAVDFSDSNVVACKAIHG